MMPRGAKPTAAGYMRVWDNDQKRKRFEHEMVWEAAHGPIPKGYEVHHRNEDKLDNRLENLELVTRLDHKRHHSRYYRLNFLGHWERYCKACDQWKLVTSEHWYFTKNDWIAVGLCRPCHIAAVKERRSKLTGVRRPRRKRGR